MERERTIDYVSKTYVNPIREASLDKPKPTATTVPPSPSRMLRSTATRNTTSVAHVVVREDQVKVEVRKSDKLSSCIVNETIIHACVHTYGSLFSIL